MEEKEFLQLKKEALLFNQDTGLISDNIVDMNKYAEILYADDEQLDKMILENLEKSKEKEDNDK